MTGDTVIPLWPFVVVGLCFVGVFVFVFFQERAYLRIVGQRKDRR